MDQNAKTNAKVLRISKLIPMSEWRCTRTVRFHSIQVWKMGCKRWIEISKMKNLELSKGLNKNYYYYYYHYNFGFYLLMQNLIWIFNPKLKQERLRGTEDLKKLQNGRQKWLWHQYFMQNGFYSLIAFKMMKQLTLNFILTLNPKIR